MKYLFHCANKYLDINNKEIIINNDLQKQIDSHGFNISELKNISKDVFVNRKLVTTQAINSNGIRINLKVNSGRFIILKLNADIKNLCFTNKYKMLVSKDGIIWRSYYDAKNFSEKQFNISVNNLNIETMNKKDKEELLYMMDYTRETVRPTNFINTEEVNFVFVGINNLINKVSQEETDTSYLIYDEENLNIDCNKENVKITNTSSDVLKVLEVVVLKSSAHILNTLKEF